MNDDEHKSVFSQRTLVPGTVKGFRTFTVDNEGTLRGVSRPEPFAPGENVGVCLLWQHSDPAALGVDHTVAAKDCTCGYYGYFDGTNDYHHSPTNQVEALIEGYGRVTMGSRGFRAEKARLLALIHPYFDERKGSHPLWLDKFVDFSAKGNNLFGTSMTLQLMASALIIWLFLAGHSVYYAYPLLAISIAISLLSSRVYQHQRDREFMGNSSLRRAIHNDGVPGLLAPQDPACKDRKRVLEKKATFSFDALVEKYPDVPYFGTLEEAKAAFGMEATSQEEVADE